MSMLQRRLSKLVNLEEEKWSRWSRSKVIEIQLPRYDLILPSLFHHQQGFLKIGFDHNIYQKIIRHTHSLGFPRCCGGTGSHEDRTWNTKMDQNQHNEIVQFMFELSIGIWPMMLLPNNT